MANGYGYEEWNPAEKAAAEEQEKALAATKAAEEEQAFIEAGGAGGGFVAGPQDALGGLLTGNGGTGVTGNGNGTNGTQNGMLTPDQAKTNIVQNGGANGVPTIPTTPTTPQPGVQNGQQTNGENIMGAGNQGYTGGQGFVPGGNGTVTDGGTITDGDTATNGAITGQLPEYSAGQHIETSYGFHTLTPEDVTALNTGKTMDQLVQEKNQAFDAYQSDTQGPLRPGEKREDIPTGKGAVSTAPVSTIQQSSEDDLTDEDFSNLWGKVTRGDISMADIGNWLRFETIDVGEGITGGTKLTARSNELLKQAFEVSEIDREKEQIAYAKDIENAKLTGDFRGAETLELRKTKYQEKLARAEATGMFGEEATLAKQKLDLEERIDYANRTGMYKDPNTNRYEKTLLLKKMEQDKELADAEMEMQKTALMGADPDGVVTFAKEQWLDKINTEKDRYDDAVTQQGLENDMMMLEILGTSKRDAYVYDENGNIQFDRDGEPILQTLAARRLAEDMLTGQVNRDDIAARTAELVRSNEKAEEFRLMEIMGFDKDKAKTFATKQFDEKVRVAKKAEELRETELELERTMLASQMDLQRQQLGSQNLALMLQNPAAFGALTALTGGGMPQQLQGLGMQVPTTQQPAQTAPQTPQQGIGQFFQGGIPTLGQLGQLDPQALQTLTNMLGFAGGITPQQFGQAAAGVTPGGVQAPPPRVYPQNAIQAVTSGRLV